MTGLLFYLREPVPLYVLTGIAESLKPIAQSDISCKLIKGRCIRCGL